MSSQTLSNVYRQTRRNRAAVKDEKPQAHAVIVPKKQENGEAHHKSDEETLRDFDLTLEYGPCIGISRMERWQRAEKHGLSPPHKVKEIIQQHGNDPAYTQSLWNGYNI